MMMAEAAWPADDAYGAIPFDAPHPRTGGDVWYDTKSGLDFIMHNLPRAHALFVRVNPYPAPWRALRVDVVGGVSLAAWYGPGDPGAPAVLMLPGTFQTKDDTPRKRRAIDLWRRTGAHVLILDQRGFGGSHAVMGSAGLHEPDDALAAAWQLAELAGASRVRVWGESLGGAVALLAACRPDAGEILSDVITWSAFADLADASLVADRSTPAGRSLVGGAYRFLLRARVGHQTRTFDDYLRIVCDYEGIAAATLMARASPERHLRDLKVPAVDFHAEDDAIVSVDHARRLEHAEAANLRVHITPRGGHLDFDRVAPAWYREVVDTWWRAAP